MKKTLIALSIAAALSPTMASADGTKEADQTETMVVTANRTVQEQFDVLAAVDVFDRDAIEQIQPRSLADLLSRVAGISTTTSGTTANNTAMFVRGGNSDHVLILIDGVRIGSATLGQKSIGDIPMQLVERVEVIRGPRAALWGSDAIGGVIQIFTRKLAQSEGLIGTEFGNDNMWRAHGAVGFGNTDHQYTLAASTERSDGFDVISPDPNGENDDDGYDKKSVSLNGKSQITEQYSIGLSAQMDKGSTEFDSGFGGNEFDFENYFLQLTNQLSVGTGFVKLNFAQSEDANRDNADSLVAGSTAAVYETSRDQINLLGSMPVTEYGEITAGYDWYNESVTSHNAYAKTKREVNAAYVVGRIDINKFKLEGSVRRDDVGDVRSETTNQLAVGYHVSDDILISYSQGSAFKAPTFNDLYWPEEFGSKGNPTLKSELADNKEFLLRVRGETFSVEMSAYETDYENLIEWGFNDVTFFFEPGNVDNAKIKGAEITLNVNVFDTSNRLSLAHVDAKNTATGMQLNRRPNFTAFYELFYQGNQWDMSLELNYQGKRNDIGGQLAGYTLANVNFSYEVSEQLRLRAKVSNLGDKDYVQAASWPGADVAAYQGADRGYSLAVDYRF
jgi:vitamin B12 transporter